MKPTRRIRRPQLSGRIPLLAVVLLGAALGFMPLAGAALQQEPEKVDKARETLREWVRTRTVLDEEKAEWAVEKEMLESQIELVELELERLRARIDETRKELDSADDEAAELAERDAEYAATEAAMAELVGALELRVRELLPRLPKAVRSEVQLFAQRIPADPADTQLGVGERFMSLIAILNSVNKQHRDLHVTSELRELPNGSTKEVSTLYLGIGQAWYASSDGTSGGYGRSTPEGWKWTAADDYAEEIHLAIRIQQNEAPAEFVRLPLTLD